MRMFAPAGTSGASFGGSTVEVDPKTGACDVPDECADDARLHGFLDEAQAEAIAAQAEAAAVATATAAATLKARK